MGIVSSITSSVRGKATVTETVAPANAYATASATPELASNGDVSNSINANVRQHPNAHPKYPTHIEDKSKQISIFGALLSAITTSYLDIGNNTINIKEQMIAEQQNLALTSALLLTMAYDVVLNISRYM